MKNIDLKSTVIGILFTTLVFVSIGATGKTDKWDDNQQWAYSIVNFMKEKKDLVKVKGLKDTVLQSDVAPATPIGWEPMSVTGEWPSLTMVIRKRIK